jgi:hypothetical protein
MFLPEVPAAKLYTRDGQTLDPKKLNASFRDAAEKIRYVQSLKYSYSIMQYDLNGMDLQAISDTGCTAERRFIIRPPADCEIIGAHLSARNVPAEQRIFARWLSAADTVLDTAAGPGAGAVVPVPGQIAFIQGNLSGPSILPILEPVSLPIGGETASWKYIEATGEEGFIISEDITQRNLRLNANENYILEMGSSDPMTIGSTNPAELTLWIRSNRGTDDEWPMIELLDGRDIPFVTPPIGAPAGTRGIGDIVADLNAQAAEAISPTNQDTFRCDVSVITDVDLTTSANRFEQEFAQRIPRPPDELSNGPYAASGIRTDTRWSLYRVDLGLVSQDLTFCQGVGSVFPLGISLQSDGVHQPPAAGTNFYSYSNPLVSQAGTQYKEVYIAGQVADGAAGNDFQINSSLPTPADPLNPSHDLRIASQVNPLPLEDVKLAYLYIWYRLTP